MITLLGLCSSSKGWYTYDVHENCPVFKTPSTPPCPSTSKILPPPSPQFQTNFLSPLSPNGNQWIKRKYNPRMTIIFIRSFLQVGCRFQYQLIHLVWLSFDFFSFNWSFTSCFFVALYSFVSSYPKISWILFIVIHFFSTYFATNLFYLHNLKTQANYGITIPPCMWMNEIKTKTSLITSHSNWPRVLLFDLTHKLCKGIIERWFHCLTSESKRRFLVSNILMFGSVWCLVMAQIQFSLIKKTLDIQNTC